MLELDCVDIAKC